MATPTRVEADATQITISWDDGHQSLHPNTQLREACPCAFCVDERTRERLIQPGSVPRDIRPLKLNAVGRYAINIEWSDGHNTGIYTYRMLRELCQCPECLASQGQPAR